MYRHNGEDTLKLGPICHNPRGRNKKKIQKLIKIKHGDTQRQAALADI